jgi:hypothetical protein
MFFALEADYLLTLTLSPAVYTVNAGGQITISGFFTTSDALTFTYSQDTLFGLSATSPHLVTVPGSVLSSQNFNPPVDGAYFEDIFGGAGYLGPTTINGPTVTPVSDLRTFMIPTDTPEGTYYYSYGADLFAPGRGTILFSEFTIDVVPEPPSLALLASCLLVAAAILSRKTTLRLKR